MQKKHKTKKIDDKYNRCYNNNAGRITLYTRPTELTFKRHVMSSAMRVSW